MKCHHWAEVTYDFGKDQDDFVLGVRGAVGFYTLAPTQLGLSRPVEHRLPGRCYLAGYGR
jgi:hypothetical protein